MRSERQASFSSIKTSLDWPKLNQGNYALDHNGSSKEIVICQWNNQNG